MDGAATGLRPFRPVSANEAVVESGRLAGEALSATMARHSPPYFARAKCLIFCDVDR